ncbi:MAG: WD40 repeat domain-containing serine/threonine protein kinase [Planctomycetota bacterium]|jgi:serine/threonine protein kinase|nr:WD40 repeat domain-containing serine/threonine protein kinase [Planctomycetota bacterium]
MLGIDRPLGGRYELLERIGRGGMGAVFRARHIGLERFCAVKILQADPDIHGEQVDRFRQEAMATAQLTQENIVTIYDVDRDQGYDYLAMELVTGGSLSERLDQESRLPWRKAVELTRQSALGLQAAHAKGIIHRDVKPANLMISEEGKIKVTDFGLARLSEGTAHISRTGQIVGTPSYMSPEQARGLRSIDARTDIYSLGATLYHLVSGRTPFEATSATACLVKILQETPRPLMEVDESLPPDLSHVVSRMMAGEQKDRYPNMGEVISDLDRLLSGRSVDLVIQESQEIRSRKLRQGGGFRFWAIGGGLICLLMGWLLLGRTSDEVSEKKDSPVDSFLDRSVDSSKIEHDFLVRQGDEALDRLRGDVGEDMENGKFDIARVRLAEFRKAYGQQRWEAGASDIERQIEEGLKKSHKGKMKVGVEKKDSSPSEPSEVPTDPAKESEYLLQEGLDRIRSEVSRLSLEEFLVSFDKFLASRSWSEECRQSLLSARQDGMLARASDLTQAERPDESDQWLSRIEFEGVSPHDPAVIFRDRLKSMNELSRIFSRGKKGDLAEVLVELDRFYRRFSSDPVVQQQVIQARNFLLEDRWNREMKEVNELLEDTAGHFLRVRKFRENMMEIFPSEFLEQKKFHHRWFQVEAIDRVWKACCERLRSLRGGVVEIGSSRRKVSQVELLPGDGDAIIYLRIRSDQSAQLRLSRVSVAQKLEWALESLGDVGDGWSDLSLGIVAWYAQEEKDLAAKYLAEARTSPVPSCRRLAEALTEKWGLKEEDEEVVVEEGLPSLALKDSSRWESMRVDSWGDRPPQALLWVPGGEAALLVADGGDVKPPRVAVLSLGGKSRSDMKWVMTREGLLEEPLRSLSPWRTLKKNGEVQVLAPRLWSEYVDQIGIPSSAGKKLKVDLSDIEGAAEGKSVNWLHPILLRKKTSGLQKISGFVGVTTIPGEESLVQFWDQAASRITALQVSVHEGVSVGIGVDSIGDSMLLVGGPESVCHRYQLKKSGRNWEWVKVEEGVIKSVASIRGVYVEPEGHLMALTHWDNGVEIWDLRQDPPRCVGRWQSEEDCGEGLPVAWGKVPGMESVLFVGQPSGSILLLDVPNCRELGRLGDHSGKSVDSIVFRFKTTKRGRRVAFLAAGDQKGQVRIWRWHSGK